MTNNNKLERLKNVMEKLNLRQVDVCKMLTVKSSFFSDIMNGRRTLTDKFLVKVSFSLNVNAEFLKTGNGNMFNDGKPVITAKYKANTWHYFPHCGQPLK